MTQILPADKQSITRAAELLQAGELVAFPTETVYGLGADATNFAAVRKIFVAKGRPSDNPLIVHIADWEQLNEVAAEVSPLAHKLMETFWPGPLTFVLPKKQSIPAEVTGNTNTVAVRWPAHPVAQALIQAVGTPIAAPSANLSGRPSPTTAQHVYEDLRDQLPLILDGGPTQVGLESTVIEVRNDAVYILRSGGISQEELKRVMDIPVVIARHTEDQESPRSPGTKYRHYAPNAQVILVGQVTQEVIDQYRQQNKRVGVISLEDLDTLSADQVHSFGGQVEQLAQQLFATFRHFDEQKCDVILFVKVAEEGIGQAIMERVRKASKG